MTPRKTRVANHRLALFPIAVTIGVFALVTWAAISLAQPPIPHAGPPAPGEPGEFPDCLFCHQSGVVGSPRVVSDHVAYANEDCLTCHEFLMHPDAAFSHSDLLVGRHSELWCEDCHEGVQRPGSQCADCHEPVPVPHFGTECEDCHTPEGFGEADAGDFEHPLILEGAHATLACSDCHIAGQELSSDCASCHQPPSEPHFGDVCQDCHTPEGFKDVDVQASAVDHPVALEGAHATLACTSCHTTDQKLVYDCAECHQPPSQPHFGNTCQDCHTPEGFKVVDVNPANHPVALEGAHAALACSSCHTGGRQLTYDCAECHQPPSQPHFGNTCQDCHTPTSFKNVDLGAFTHPVALEGAHAELACSNCHTGNQQLTYECSECHEPPGDDHFGSACQNCHTPQGWSESAEHLEDEAEEIPHDLEGREDCLLCHDPEGQVKPAPSSHADYANEQCVICHETES